VHQLTQLCDGHNNKIYSDERMEFIKGSHAVSTNVTEHVTLISSGFKPFVMVYGFELNF
jgi:hypothetical protein